MSVSILSESGLDHHTATVTEVYAQPYVETVKHRNLTIDLGNGLKTNAQLTVPAVGKGPFPGVIFSGPAGAGSVISPTSPVIYYGISIFQKEDLPFLDMTSRVLDPSDTYSAIIR